MRNFAIVTPGNGNGKLLTSLPKCYDNARLWKQQYGAGGRPALPPAPRLPGSREILVEGVKALLSWARPAPGCSAMYQAGLIPAPRATRGAAANSQDVSTLSWVQEGFLPRQHCQAVTLSSAARCSLVEMLGVAKDRVAPQPLTLPDASRLNQPKGHSKMPTVLGWLYNACIPNCLFYLWCILCSVPLRLALKAKQKRKKSTEFGFEKAAWFPHIPSPDWVFIGGRDRQWHKDLLCS